jgi:cytochrome c556
MKKRVSPIVITTFTACASLGLQAGLLADEQEAEKAPIHYKLQTIEENPIGYRRMVKQSFEGHMGAYGLILTAKAPHPEHGQSHIDAMAVLAEQQRVLFPEGSESAGTRPEIWSQPEAFAAALEKTSAAAIFLKEKYEEGNRHLILNALVKLGESCRSCHERFRDDNN